MEFCVETVAGLEFRGPFARSVDSLSLSLSVTESYNGLQTVNPPTQWELRAFHSHA